MGMDQVHAIRNDSDLKDGGSRKGPARAELPHFDTSRSFDEVEIPA